MLRIVVFCDTSVLNEVHTTTPGCIFDYSVFILVPRHLTSRSQLSSQRPPRATPTYPPIKEFRPFLLYSTARGACSVGHKPMALVVFAN